MLRDHKKSQVLIGICKIEKSTANLILEKIITPANIV
jgi:hypothetical protein